MHALTTAGIGVLALAATGAAVASATPANNARGVEIIRALRTTEAQQTLDLGPQGDTLGDEQAFTARFDVQGKTVGFDGGVCTLVRLPRVYQCVATNSLPKGQLSAQGLVDFDRAPGPYHFAITGGTERYESARGSVTVLFGQDNDQVTFHIITQPRAHE